MMFPPVLARLQGVILGLTTAAAVGDAPARGQLDGAVLSQLRAAGRVQAVLPAP